ncbi:MAG: cyanophycin synthetase [Bacteroidia bacterium]
MEILETKVLRGPNYWSNYRKQLIALKVDIAELEELPTHKIDGFSERIRKLLPTLQEHHCSEGCEGGFFIRLKKGTWAGHVMEHIALEIQCLAGMECGYGRTRSADQRGVYNIIFGYEIEEAGLYAAKAALRITKALFDGLEYDLEEDILHLKELKRKLSFGPSTQSIINEAVKRDIPFKRLGNDSLVILGQGNKQRKIRASIACSTSNIGLELAGDKNATKKLLAAAFVPVPAGVLIRDPEEIDEALDKINFPVVVKPVDGNHGRGITTNISSREEVVAAFPIAKLVSDKIIIEEFVEGDDYRFLVVNYKVVAVARRSPAMISGDGISTIAELIEKENSNPLRGDGHENVMSRIKVDEVTEHILARNEYTLSSVPAAGKIIYLKDTANLSSGGTATDVTDFVHPLTKASIERAAKILNLNICGVDVVAKDITEPFSRKTGAIVEVNACPGLRMHLSPSVGLKRNVAEPIIDMLFPNNDNGRIPVVAVTGTNGKTTTTRLIAHIASHVGHKVGFATTDGIYIQGTPVHYGDCTGPVSATAVLTDPTIDFAVLESARGGILRSGLGFDSCDIGIVTNVTEDHLGLKDIHTLEEMAKVKSVVAKSVSYNGFVILNADDDLVYQMKDEADANVALFSVQADNPRILRHCRRGGYAALIENGLLTICKGEWKTHVERIDNIPLSLNGRAASMIKNILPAVLACVLRNFDITKIREALQTFIPSPEQTPGRMNVFNFNDFHVMVDYAHNRDGYLELKKFLDNTHAEHKVAVVSATGDRRDEDIRIIGKLCAKMFDEIILRHDIDLRGRDKDELISLLKEGISEEKEMEVKVISDEREAIRFAIAHARRNSFIYVGADSVMDTIRYIEEERKMRIARPPLVSVINEMTD